ncbi:MAG TPA: hypothetical protein VGT41_02235 [Candidatus Babeliales bacterium]|nr:hypothetical protein [Candidatus Babeliales bacterium]
MNFKHIALVLFTLLPMMSICNQVENRIKELKEAQVAKSQDILETIALGIERAKIYLKERKVVLEFWELGKEDLFNDFLDELIEAFYSGRDIEVLIERSLLNNDTRADLKFLLIEVAVAKFLYRQSLSHYEKLVNELTDVNIELHRLQKEAI